MNVPATVDAMRFTVSGIGDLGSVTPDEAVLLRDYQAVRDSGRGSLYVEFSDMKVTKYDVRHGGGSVLLNSLLPVREKRFKD